MVTVLQKTGVDSESAEKNAYCIEHEISGKTYEYSIGLLKKQESVNPYFFGTTQKLFFC